MKRPVEAPEVLELEYHYPKHEECEYKNLLGVLEREFGGTREPYLLKAGAIDLVTFFEIVLSFTVSLTIKPVISKYLEGFLNTDKVKQLGEEHRKIITDWFLRLESDVSKLIDLIQRIDIKRIPIEDKERALAITIYLGKRTTLYVVLNHEARTPRLMANLPIGLTKAVRFLAERGIPEDALVCQLYFDKETEKWKYLFMPSLKGLGNWIDRYVDLDKDEIRRIYSQAEFLKIFQPNEQDKFKFLVGPFRESQ
ncbi:MAG: hypothetical protein QMD05_02765 [Candidatus Brocadiaceae bacterium]|nr:hypothetical protein [Candidatus Brocadiaceae bacterium]